MDYAILNSEYALFIEQVERLGGMNIRQNFDDIMSGLVYNHLDMSNNLHLYLPIHIE